MTFLPNPIINFSIPSAILDKSIFLFSRYFSIELYCITGPAIN